MLKIAILTLKISFACSFGGKLTNILHFKNPKLFRLFFGQVHECFRSALACIHSRCDILFTGLSTLSPFISHSLFLSLSVPPSLLPHLWSRHYCVFEGHQNIFKRVEGMGVESFDKERKRDQINKGDWLFKSVLSVAFLTTRLFIWFFWHFVILGEI